MAEVESSGVAIHRTGGTKRRAWNCEKSCLVEDAERSVGVDVCNGGRMKRALLEHWKNSTWVSAAPIGRH